MQKLRSRTCQRPEDVAGSSSGGSEGPWNILSPFLECFATPTTKRGKNVSIYNCPYLENGSRLIILTIPRGLKLPVFFIS